MTNMVKYVLSALVMPCTDDYFVLEVRKATLREARAFVKDGDFVSAVGHESTAKILSKLLGVEIKPNRIFVDLKKGDVALATQFLVRLEEGKILDENELLKLYDESKIVFRIIERLE